MYLKEYKRDHSVIIQTLKNALVWQRITESKTFHPSDFSYGRKNYDGKIINDTLKYHRP